MRFKTILSTGLLAMVLVIAASAQANPSRVTRGDAQAVLDASGAGGWSVRLHAGEIRGAPAAFTPGDRVRIAPIPGVFDGIHYCSLDWHVVAINDFDGNAPGESRTPSEIAAALAGDTWILSVDGTPLSTVRTPVKRFLNPEQFGLVDAYYFATGRVMAPTDLSIGAHTVSYVVLISGEVVDTAEVTFFIDAPGTGTCL